MRNQKGQHLEQLDWQSASLGPVALVDRRVQFPAIAVLGSACRRGSYSWQPSIRYSQTSIQVPTTPEPRGEYIPLHHRYAISLSEVSSQTAAFLGP